MDTLHAAADDQKYKSIYLPKDNSYSEIEKYYDVTANLNIRFVILSEAKNLNEYDFEMPSRIKFGTGCTSVGQNENADIFEKLNRITER